MKLKYSAIVDDIEITDMDELVDQLFDCLAYLYDATQGNSNIPIKKRKAVKVLWKLVKGVSFDTVAVLHPYLLLQVTGKQINSLEEVVSLFMSNFTLLYKGSAILPTEITWCLDSINTYIAMLDWELDKYTFLDV